MTIKTSVRTLVKPANFSDNISDYCLGLSRIAALGYMSSTMMHDIGNALTVISGNSQIIQIKKNNQTVDQIQVRIETILDQINRIQNITDRVGSFGARLSGDFKKIDPTLPVTNAFYALSRRFSLAGIRNETNIVKKKAVIFCDPSILEFIFIEFLSLFLKVPVNEGNLTVVSSSDKNNFSVEAWLKPTEIEQKLFEHWDDPNLESNLFTPLAGLEGSRGGAKLFKNNEGVGWCLTFAQNIDEE
ncbi:MAG: hypothetical protein HN356_01190 [Calditrichaeota bacterium]|nr:hypothetical protein [Calditrichota bacterium]MBT5427096.1 hypothetical protein [Bacteroidota bacterium]